MRRVSSIQEAKPVLEYFKGFHDGFVRRFAVLADVCNQDKPRASSGEAVDLEIAIDCTGHTMEGHSAQQRVVARFYRVRGLSTPVGGLSSEFSLDGLSMTETFRTAANGDRERCLRAALVQPRAAEGRDRKRQKGLVFTFRSAEFTEIF